MKRRIRAFARAFVHFTKFLFLLTIILGLGGSFLHDIIDSPTQMGPGLGLIALLVVCALGEHSWRKFLPRYYFRYGILVLKRDFPIFPAENMPTNLASLPRTSKSKGLLPQIDIQPLNDFEYGLWANAIESRDRLFRRRMANYSPLTHAFLALDRDNNTLKLRVYLNWFTLPFLAIWFGAASFIPASHLLFKTGLIVIGALVVIKLLSDEKEQYLRIWDAVRRYTYGEYDIGAVERNIT